MKFEKESFKLFVRSLFADGRAYYPGYICWNFENGGFVFVVEKPKNCGFFAIYHTDGLAMEMFGDAWKSVESLFVGHCSNEAFLLIDREIDATFEEWKSDFAKLFEKTPTDSPKAFSAIVGEIVVLIDLASKGVFATEDIPKRFKERLEMLYASNIISRELCDKVSELSDFMSVEILDKNVADFEEVFRKTLAKFVPEKVGMKSENEKWILTDGFYVILNEEMRRFATLRTFDSKEHAQKFASEFGWDEIYPVKISK